MNFKFASLQSEFLCDFYNLIFRGCIPIHNTACFSKHQRRISVSLKASWTQDTVSDVLLHNASIPWFWDTSGIQNNLCPRPWVPKSRRIPSWLYHGGTQHWPQTTCKKFITFPAIRYLLLKTTSNLLCAPQLSFYLNKVIKFSSQVFIA